MMICERNMSLYNLYKIRSKAILLIIYILKKKKSYELSINCIQSKTTVHCNDVMMSKNITDTDEMMM